MKINESETFAKPSMKAVIKYKTLWLIYSLKDIKSKAKWLINLIWKLYCKYVELYDFGDLF